MIKKYLVFVLLILYFTAGVLVIYFFDGTGDAGDSVLHYLFARYAPFHPELYFDHWAKPVFVLLGSPFAQFGMKGMKFFNLLVSLLAMYITWRSCILLNIKNSHVVPLFMILAPYAFVQTFSGLTEPLFALFLISGVYFVLKRRCMVAAIIISFLPFVRSEGLVIMGVFALYFVVGKNWKNLMLLLFGHLIYSLAGSIVHHDLLWVFNKIPYASLSSVYGHGGITHFVTQLLYVVGIPVYLLFLLGLLGYISGWLRRKERLISVNTMLILGCTLAYIIAHSLFWYFGLFNSMGLKRVLIGIMPLLAIISLQGFNLISEQKFFGPKVKTTIKVVVVAYLCVFPFTNNPAALKAGELQTDEGQKCARDVTAYINDNFSGHGKLFYAYHYFSMTFDLDHFDKSVHLELTKESLNNIKRGDLVIWDSWFAQNNTGVTSAYLDSIAGMTKVADFKSRGDKEIIYKLYTYN